MANIKMKQLCVGFCPPKSWTSKLISWRTRSKYSHAELVFDDAVYSSEPWFITKYSGVEERKTTYLDIIFVEVTPKQYADIKRFCEASVDEPYDVFGAIAWVFRAKTFNSDLLFCFELVWEAFSAAKMLPPTRDLINAEQLKQAILGLKK